MIFPNTRWSVQTHGWRIWTLAESSNEGIRVEATGGKFLSFAQAVPIDRWVFTLFIIITHHF